MSLHTMIGHVKKLCCVRLGRVTQNIGLGGEVEGGGGGGEDSYAATIQVENW